MPSAPAKADSTTPPFGLGWALASRLPCVRRSARLRRRRDHRKQAREPRAGQVREVVELRRGPAVVLVAGVVVTDHRAEGVHRAIAEQPRNTADRSPHQRGDDGVGGVLRDRLDDGPSDLGLVEGRSVATDQMGQPLPCGRQVVGSQMGVYGERLAFEGASAEHGPRRDRRGQHPGRAVLGRDAERDRPADREAGVRDSAGARVGVQETLEGRGRGAEAGDRVEALRVPEDPVGREAEQHP
ncbi:hypothetical protein LP418_18765 [Nocardioides sp. B-3]|nr:hypothetical protein [Nocardioides sp. B-3]UUZ58268.1 hypothetical protein LP418_18765 [Nocardioides sp. B-3]